MANKTNAMLINFSSIDLGDEKMKELEDKISAILRGESVEGMDLPALADSTTVNLGVVSHTHDW